MQRKRRAADHAARGATVTGLDRGPATIRFTDPEFEGDHDRKVTGKARKPRMMVLQFHSRDVLASAISGKRRSIVSIAICVSIRATGAPMQM
jgi:hypothetical protein